MKNKEGSGGTSSLCHVGTGSSVPHRGHRFKHACAHFLGRGTYWCGEPPAGDRGGALAVPGQVAFVRYFWESERSEGHRGGCQQRVLTPSLLHPLLF